MRFVKIAAFNILITLVLLELSLFAASKLGVLNMDLPSYTLANVSPFWSDTNKDFGVWHPASSQYRHTRSCFDVTYRSNAHGMRDRERALQSPEPRVVVLGDSFVEGFGVADAARLTDLLEAKTGLAHMNFGTSGNFGLTQSLVLYKAFARQFEHQAVVLGILPDNDFTDDNWENADTVYRNRYRPYLVGPYPNYELRYSNPNVIAAKVNDFGKVAELLLLEFSYTARAYSFLQTYRKAVRETKTPGDKGGEKIRASRYFDYAPEEFDRMRYVIEQVVALASPRPVMVMSIPRLSDYARAAKESRPAPLSEALHQLASKTGFTYVDLLERSAGRANPAELFFKCDPHWNGNGHAMAAKELAGWTYYGRGKTPAPHEQADQMPVGALPRSDANAIR
jgi:hypothetical protein